MTVVLYWREETEQTTNLTSWQTVFSLGSNAGGGVVPEGSYKIHVYAELSGVLTNRNVGIQLVLDGAVRCGPFFYKPSMADAYWPFHMMDSGELDDTVDHTVEVQIISEIGSQTTKVRHIRVYIEKH